MSVFAAVHERLRDIVLKNRGDLVVTKDGPAGMALEVPGLEGKPWGYVAGTRVGTGYVSYYLMPVYVSPELEASLSPELLRRKQGKACFNFTKVDEGLFDELDALTARTVPGFRAVAEELAARRR
ncbi:MAG: hypothetical protein H0V73_03950 [Chloroflexi bacterium]|nr:hypothetical protein [Chloroflexota bacterium]